MYRVCEDDVMHNTPANNSSLNYFSMHGVNFKILCIKLKNFYWQPFNFTDNNHKDIREVALVLVLVSKENFSVNETSLEIFNLSQS